MDIADASAVIAIAKEKQRWPGLYSNRIRRLREISGNDFTHDITIG
ncbi:hypothetical protein CFter6_3493 [Collimonas fungivorans]|uniref:Uncharacterized protein n=1 Tax=Collimonas fungivorans TaxID=158899 RepID=A0A127PE92_9BURK|nr:hypothetical protein [Collimonas fungivorans]AMO96126.1 hypothetical protein CFter6_3493 [Collimonas fungivorans]